MSHNVWVALMMPLSVTSEYNKDYYDPNVVYTSFGRNKTSSSQTGHSWGGQEGDMTEGGCRIDAE